VNLFFMEITAVNFVNFCIKGNWISDLLYHMSFMSSKSETLIVIVAAESCVCLYSITITKSLRLVSYNELYSDHSSEGYQGWSTTSSEWLFPCGSRIPKLHKCSLNGADYLNSGASHFIIKLQFHWLRASTI
jgi:hypothetical protein